MSRASTNLQRGQRHTQAVSKEFKSLLQARQLQSMASPLSAARSARKVVHNVAGKRFLSDISITRTGKPIIRVEGGR